MYSIKIEAYFSAAHYLRGYRGKCEELHGHNWKVEVTVEAEKPDKIGMGLDFKYLKMNKIYYLHFAVLASLSILIAACGPTLPLRSDLPLNGLTEAWIVTNTKITNDAINYALCTGLKTISWNYPARGNIRDLIENSGLAPITVLSSLSDAQKQKLLENHFVLCKTISMTPSCLDALGLAEDKKNKILEETHYVLGNFKH